MFDILENTLKEYDNHLNLYNISHEQIVFENRVFLNCFYCSRYDTKWTCPPRIPKLNYQNIISEYNNIAIVSFNTDINENNFDDMRSKSTNILHHSLLFLEKTLMNHNNSLAISFIGGSCKLCKNGCSIDRCMNKSMSRIPLEAIGVNVVKTLANIGIDIIFPVKTNLSRYGMILW